MYEFIKLYMHEAEFFIFLNILFIVIIVAIMLGILEYKR